MVEENYKVRLDMFEGPLDLLLYLIKKDEVDICDISIERVTRQFLEYVDTFKLLNIDLAGEFIVMAANLMYLKSRTLLPKQVQLPDADADEEDPRWELIRQLIEYKKFKDAAGFLQRRAMQNETFFPAVPEAPEGMIADDGVEPFPEVSIFDLIRAFQGVLDRFSEEKKTPTLHEIVDDRWTVADKIEFLLTSVPPGEQVRFFSLFAAASSRDEIIVTFVAMLELIKLRQFRISQDSLLGEITLIRNENT
ncbi:MAG: segregation/condensation protein A [Verrucomicrobiales bacterium]|nr:segregation/condensation protein A [Verrucomicrobiales bacterium]